MSSASRRVQRVEKELRQIVAQYLLVGFKEHLEGLVSVTRAKVSPDLRQAWVSVSMLGDNIDVDENLSRLQSRAQDFQREVHRLMPMKYCPKIQFVFDDSTEKILKVERLLAEIREQKNQSPADREDSPQI